MTAPSPRDREIADAIFIAWQKRGGWDWRDLVARALAAARAEGMETCATWHADEAQSHRHDAQFNSSDAGERIRHIDWTDFHAECAEHFRAIAKEPQP